MNTDFTDYTDYTDYHLIRVIREICLICVGQLTITNLMSRTYQSTGINLKSIRNGF